MAFASQDMVENEDLRVDAGAVGLSAQRRIYHAYIMAFSPHIYITIVAFV
jgi:hypothetical protein